MEFDYLTSSEVERAQRVTLETSAPVDVVLTELGLISDEELAGFWANWLNIPKLDEQDVPEQIPFEDVLSRKFLTANSVVPISFEDNILSVAMSRPLDTNTIRSIEYLIDVPVKVFSAEKSQIVEILRDIQDQDSETDSLADDSTYSQVDINQDIEQLKALASEGPIIQRVNTILSNALDRDASDIHLEPEQFGYCVRFRIDGHLQDVERIEQENSAAVISRIKIMARMDITERRIPQDGRISTKIRGRDLDLRISTLPTVHGESTVVRLLRRDGANLNWETLGFSDRVRAQILDILSHPNGIFLVTGPTGSGKTTTLYTALRELNTRNRKLVSVEDPVEYQLAGINQVQVHTDLGLSFAKALRSILRQDPDIIMIGEIRDVETAEIAIRASLTGHLVLSTLHTNNAAAAITRLIEMGVPSYLVAACVRGVLSQRLIRTICQVCSKPISSNAMPSTIKERICKSIIESDFREPKGCESCNGSGYTGRTVISELLTVNSKVKELILSGKSEQVIGNAACESGMIQLLDAGLSLAAQGQSSIEEIISATGYFD